MILPDFNDFPRTGRVLGVDWGLRRTGIAISDQEREFFFTRPAITMGNKEKSIARQIADLAKEENITGIVIGLPLYSDGSDSETTSNVRKFAKELSSYTDLPIAFIDETLTSISAQEEIGRMGIENIKNRLDSESARLILENAIAIIKRL